MVTGRRWASCCAALLLAAVAAPAVAQAPDSVGIRLLELPASRQDDPRAQVAIVDHVAPGAVLTRRVEVANGTGDVLPVAVEVGAAQVAGGSFVPDDDAPHGVHRWASVAPARLEVPRGQRATAAVTIEVPVDTPPGEYLGAIWAVPPAGEGPTRVVNRVGVRIYLSVGPGAEPATDFALERLRGVRLEDGTPAVEVLVRNSGGRVLDPRGQLELRKGPGGLRAGPFDSTVGLTLAPGEVGPVVFLLDSQTPAGPWLARVEVSSGTVLRAAEATIEFPTEPGSRGPDVDAEPAPVSGQRQVLVPAAAGLLALALILLVLVVSRRRRRDGRQRPEQPGPEGAPDQDPEPVGVGSGGGAGEGS